MRAWSCQLNFPLLRCAALQLWEASTVGYRLRHQTHLDVSLRFGNIVPDIIGTHQMLDTGVDLPRISCPSSQNIRFDNWCFSHLLGDNNSSGCNFQLQPHQCLLGHPDYKQSLRQYLPLFSRDTDTQHHLGCGDHDFTPALHLEKSHQSIITEGWTSLPLHPWRLRHHRGYTSFEYYGRP